MLDTSIPDDFGERNPEIDPFGEDFFLAPYAEELADRAARMRDDYRDAIRHFVEVLAWELMDNPDLKEVAILLLWNWEEVEIPWIAEAFFRDVRQVCEVAESHPVRAYNCLRCGKELRVRSRKHMFRLARSLEAVCEGGDEDAIANLLCRACGQQLAEHAEAQQRLSRLMHEAVLAERRRMPYAKRRTTKEWRVLRNQKLEMAGYCCQLCDRSGRDVQLDVHHRTYQNYGSEKLEDLIVLCRRCHAHHHSVDEAS